MEKNERKNEIKYSNGKLKRKNNVHAIEWNTFEDWCDFEYTQAAYCKHLP